MAGTIKKLLHKRKSSQSSDPAAGPINNNSLNRSDSTRSHRHSFNKIPKSLSVPSNMSNPSSMSLEQQPDLTLPTITSLQSKHSRSPTRDLGFRKLINRSTTDMDTDDEEDVTYSRVAPVVPQLKVSRADTSSLQGSPLTGIPHKDNDDTPATIGSDGKDGKFIEDSSPAESDVHVPQTGNSTEISTTNNSNTGGGET
ncbi:unnamed protein product [Ambrosiozyma monospora]|uniref:Unnamed protein product n=1 Tax=Ambrosiozyma monospora TaxID=43982 RepID=A0ACB5TD56_AMBMO|nr:unnamed protein product [Ambrosiozyma monospora]